MQDYTLVRQGLPPIKFTGKLLSEAETADQSFKVRIYRSKGDRFIPEIERSYRNETVYKNASAFLYAKDAIEWLKEGEPTLGKISQEAIEKACAVDNEFASAWVEVVE
ncbi:hypothetical protein [Pedosphaera parvula]|uniref:Uncharacterized protein n=1 Tax=Pedosphaera parvula (strain Ellin514) TaxID=320771 RepID=B9XJJ7_PEDPL|nr:hypothetical protein [Pedosphaera parvula]EEF60058.1 hypothetical protein Cflav_PD3117 [Pedosphaera parvula Ellin514]